MGGSSTSTRTESPKASGLSISTATSGKAIALAWGMPRLPVNVVSYHDFEAIEQVDSQNAGGKGGGGSMESVSYLYKVGLMLGLCAGPIASVPRVFVGKAIGTPGAYNFAVVPGSWDQPIPNELLASPTLGDDGKLNYRGVAGLAAYKFDLGDSDSLPNITAEVDTGTGYSSTIRDASPGCILADYLTIAGIPASYLTELDNWSNWCVASGLFFSPAYTEREAAREAVKRLMQLTGSDIFISDGKLRVVIYADEAIAGNGVAWVPDLTPQYDLTYDDFLDSDMPVRGTRTSQSDSKNQVRLKFSNRAKDYNEDYATARDLSSIQKYGLREEEIDATQEICDANVAALSAELIKQRKCYIRGTYEFRLGWKYDRLEPGDLVTLTDDSLHLDRFLVRITEIEDDEDGVRTVQAEEVLVGAAAPSRAPVQETNGYAVDYNTVPGSLNAPAIFEPPLALSGAPQIWIAASGGENWGGCDVWVSDDGDSYKRLGRILGRARHGTLTAQLPVGGAIDSTNALAVDMTGSRGSLISGTEQNALDLITLCWVDGELLAYRDATLTGPNQYALSWLVRGAYGTQINAHAAGKQFARLDEGVAKFGYDAAKIGKQIHIKLQSFNVYGSGFVDLAEVDPISYTLVGAPLADVTGLALEQPFTGSACKIKWNAVDAAAGYTVEVWAGSPQTLRRTAQVGDARRFEYTWDDAKADGGPWRSLTFRVKAVSATGASSGWANLSASNPIPVAPSGLRATSIMGSITLTWNPADETDVRGYLAYLGTTSGFTPGTANLVSDNTGFIAYISKTASGGDLQVGATYYLRVAAYDVFGRDQVNYSNEISITVPSLSADLLELENLGPANFDTATAEAIANMQALSNADLDALAQIDTELLASMSSELQAARDAVQQQALTILNALAAQDVEAGKRREAAAAIVRETQTRITELQAVAEDILALVSRMGTAEAGITAASQAIVSGDNALSQQIGSLTSTVNSNKASADNSITTLTNADTALSQQLGSLTSTVNSNKASADNSITTLTNADTALSQQLGSLTSTVNSNKASADNSITTLTNADTALSQQIGSLTSTVNSNKASADNSITTLTNADTALSQQLGSLTSTVGQNTTNIGTLTESVDGILGRWSVSIVQYGDGTKKVSGISLLSDGTSSAFDVLADVFRVSLPDGSGSRQVFTVGMIDGVSKVGISGDLLIDGSVSARSLTSGEITAGTQITVGGAGSAAPLVLTGEGEVISNSANGNKARLYSGNVELYKAVPGVGQVLYTALSRVEMGIATNNAQVTIPGYFKSQPKIIVSPLNLGMFKSAYANQDQAIQCEANAIQETSPGSMVWKFTPVATLSLAAATGLSVVNQNSGTISANSWTSAQYVTPANTASITPSVAIGSNRGNGISQYNYRTVRWRVEYWNGSSWISGSWTTSSLGASASEINTSTAAFTFPSSGTWTFRIRCECYDTNGSVFGSVAYEYATESASRTDDAAISRTWGNGGTSTLNYTPTWTLPAGWELTGVSFAYHYNYNITLQSAVDAEISGGGLSLTHAGSGSNIAKTWTTSSNSLVFSLTTEYNSFLSQSSTASLTLLDCTGTYSLRRVIANSTTPNNTYQLNGYGYNLTSAQVLAEGSLNWLAIGD